MAPKLLIIGGGFAGSKLAIQLSKEFDVTLVDRYSSYHSMLGCLGPGGHIAALGHN
jgi:NADH dehydrogenase FAD-containing subunit